MLVCARACVYACMRMCVYARCDVRVPDNSVVHAHATCKSPNLESSCLACTPVRHCTCNASLPLVNELACSNSVS